MAATWDVTRFGEQSTPVGLGQLDADLDAEQAHEHVAVDEGAEVAEHRPDLNPQ
ncbi:MAG: hypothetical protein ACRD0A_04750 [Acidimicrobiales bacterium]